MNLQNVLQTLVRNGLPDRAAGVAILDGIAQHGKRAVDEQLRRVLRKLAGVFEDIGENVFRDR